MVQLKCWHSLVSHRISRAICRWLCGLQPSADGYADAVAEETVLALWPRRISAVVRPPWVRLGGGAHAVG